MANPNASPFSRTESDDDTSKDLAYSSPRRSVSQNSVNFLLNSQKNDQEQAVMAFAAQEQQDKAQKSLSELLTESLDNKKDKKDKDPKASVFGDANKKLFQREVSKDEKPSIETETKPVAETEVKPIAETAVEEPVAKEAEPDEIAEKPATETVEDQQEVEQDEHVETEPDAVVEEVPEAPAEELPEESTEAEPEAAEEPQEENQELSQETVAEQEPDEQIETVEAEPVEVPEAKPVVIDNRQEESTPTVEVDPEPIAESEPVKATEQEPLAVPDIEPAVIDLRQEQSAEESSEEEPVTPDQSTAEQTPDDAIDQEYQQQEADRLAAADGGNNGEQPPDDEDPEDNRPEEPSRGGGGGSTNASQVNTSPDRPGVMQNIAKGFVPESAKGRYGGIEGPLVAFLAANWLSKRRDRKLQQNIDKQGKKLENLADKTTSEKIQTVNERMALAARQEEQKRRLQRFEENPGTTTSDRANTILANQNERIINSDTNQNERTAINPVEQRILTNQERNTVHANNTRPNNLPIAETAATAAAAAFAANQLRRSPDNTPQNRFENPQNIQQTQENIRQTRENIDNQRIEHQQTTNERILDQRREIRNDSDAALAAAMATKLNPAPTQQQTRARYSLAEEQLAQMYGQPQQQVQKTRATSSDDVAKQAIKTGVIIGMIVIILGAVGYFLIFA